MSNDQSEKFYFEQLQNCLPDMPQGEISRPQPPDFLIKTSTYCLGVEFTSFFMPPENKKDKPWQEIQSFREKVVSKAERIHADKGGPTLFVSVFFSEDAVKHAKIKPDTLAKKLADAILSCQVPRTFEEGSRSYDFCSDELPGIFHVTICRSNDAHDRVWSAHSGGYTRPILPSHVMVEINRKSQKVQKARLHCEKLWLVIVYDDFFPASGSKTLHGTSTPAKLSDEARLFTYKTPFDRLLWLMPRAGPSLIELSIVKC